MEYINFLRSYLRKHAGRMDAYLKSEVELRMYLAAVWQEEHYKKDLRVALALAAQDERIGRGQS